MQDISKIVLGTAQFGLKYGINNSTGKLLEKEIFEIMDYAKKVGIGLLDTAEVYGNSHEIIGRYHKLKPKNKFKVITKFPSITNCNISLKVSEYISVLGVQNIEVLLHHSFHDYYINCDKLVPEIKLLKDNSKINLFGVSIYTNAELELAIKDKNIDFIQVPFNLLDNEFQRGDILKRAKLNGKIIQSRSVFLQGLFFSNRNTNISTIMDLKEYLFRIDTITLNSNLKTESLALAYCFEKNYIDFITLGVDNLAQLKNNVYSLKEVIPINVLKEVDEIKVDNTNLLNPALWKKEELF